jgi:phosphoribosylanthranilate isomerase
MSLRTHVIAGNITNLSDARYCAGMGVEWLSFPVSNVDPTLFKEIVQWVAGPQYVIKLDENSTAQALNEYPVECVEINASQLRLIDNSLKYKWIIEVAASDWSGFKEQLVARKNKIEFIILTSFFDDSIEVLKEACKIFNVVVDPTNENDIKALLGLQIYGLRVSGGKEIRPGLIDYEKISSILELLETED